ncbi:MAG: hypothetical protein K0S65_2260 [Labilithrix sp.]|nr:hypothetical protein [Labilithrix sp.]
MPTFGSRSRLRPVALTATVHHFEIALSDVDRNVYESLDLRVAQHPSETMQRLLVRTLAYCLAYEDGIAFSKGGLSSTDEAPIAVHDPTGLLVRSIEIGAPSAERLHRASKAAKVSVYTHELPQLLRQTEGQTIHKADAIEVWGIDSRFIDALAPRIDRRTRLELTRTDGALYVAVGGETLETTLVRASLAPAA